MIVKYERTTVDIVTLINKLYSSENKNNDNGLVRK